MMRKLIMLVSLIFLLSNTLFAQIVEVQGISCPGESTGRLYVVSDFGTGPYTWIWNTGDTEQTIEGLAAGTYTVTVTDALLASQVFTYDLTDPLPITAIYVTVNNSNWPNPNGSITITPNGGTGWMTYSLIDSTTTEEITQTNAIFNNLFSGTYFVTLTDINGCQRKDTVVVGESSGITTTFDIDYTACYRSTAPISNVRPVLVPANLPAEVQFSDDTITIIELIPGPRPYRTSVSDTVESFSSNVQPGRNIFKVVTNDNKGFRYSWVVDSVITPIKVTWTQRNILCYGDNTGVINASAEGSWGDFDYTITGPNSFSSNNNDITDLFAGRYNIHVEDSTGCSLDQSVTILQPDAPIQGSLEKKDLTCYQSDNGAITAYFSGGTGQLDYSWDSGQTTDSITGLAAGTYTLTITDENGCTLIPPSVIINEPADLTINGFVQNVSCYGYDNGRIETTPQGGNGGYRYIWERNGTVMQYNDSSIYDLSPGLYSLHLEDSLGCNYYDSWIITQPSNFQFEFVNDPITCNDELGSIRVHNLEAFDLDITLGGNTQTVVFDDTTAFNDLPIGDHLVSITNNVCVFDTTITFTQALPLVLNISAIDNLCYNGQQGIVEVNVSGGTSGPNSILVLDGTNYLGVDTTVTRNTPSNNFTINGLKAGTYSIIVTDDNGCESEEITTINQPIEGLRIHFNSETTYCPESEDGKIWVNYVENALEPVSYLWNNGRNSSEIDSLIAGWYTVEVTDANNCLAIDSIELISGDEVCIPSLITPNNDGYNDILNITNLCYHSDIEISIINQSGMVLFETNDCSLSWDGKDRNGNLISSGTFVFAYIKQIKDDGTVREFRKTITVIY